MIESTTVARPIATVTADTPWRTRVVLFLVLACIMIGLNWQLIHTVNHELGDFAANGLLIAKAKSLSLLTGNYSRVGFYHPGPAILYVLAAGELIFNDWLHLVPSPFSGQLVAVSCYSAFWLVTMFVLARRLTRTTSSAVLIMGTFALTSAFFDMAIFNGAWMPHLYCLPFATMLLAGARLAEGRADSLVALAVSCGFLINGHVSFMSTLGIIFLVVVAASKLRARPGDSFILSKSFLGTHRRAVLQFVGLILLFLLPLLILTVVQFPGPLRDYAKFGGHNKPNSLYEAFIFTRVYWGGTAMAACTGAGLCAMLWTYARHTVDAFGRAVQAMLVMVLAATLALLFYAKFGVDMLDQNYIGLFYFAVPALVVGFAVAATARAFLAPNNSFIATGFGLLLMAGTAWLVHEPVGYRNQYNQDGVVDLYRSIKALPQPKGRMVFDLDWSEDQGYVWVNMLGLQMYAKRQHDDFFCFSRNWSFSNTAAAGCTADEVAHGPRYMIRKGPHEGVAVAQGLGLFVYDRRAPDVSTRSSLTIAADAELFRQFLFERGWSDPGGDFAWSEGQNASLVLRLKPGATGNLVMDMGAFTPRPDSTQSIVLDAGRGPAAAQVFSQATPRKEVRVPFVADADGIVRLRAHIANPISPQDVGMSADGRKLGASLYGIKIEGN
jgi:hypothetical protein